MESLSKSEAQVYDRQLRLWGSSAQTRIKAARIGIVGLSPETVELAKNVVLAGAGVVLLDSRPAELAGSNFLLSLGPEGKPQAGSTVAEATREALAYMNPFSDGETNGRICMNIARPRSIGGGSGHVRSRHSRRNGTERLVDRL